ILDISTAKDPLLNMGLTTTQLANRFGLNPSSISNCLYKQPDKFSQWSQKKDPEGISWQKTQKKKGRSSLFIPGQNTDKK
ncbi:MAG: hypothetical protein AB4372_26160, partial [Xenococcus sp. (in: cyanobacteria)]